HAHQRAESRRLAGRGQITDPAPTLSRRSAAATHAGTEDPHRNIATFTAKTQLHKPVHDRASAHHLGVVEATPSLDIATKNRPTGADNLSGRLGDGAGSLETSLAFDTPGDRFRSRSATSTL
ncbi:MAG: hypothetical protein ACLFTL_11235, partial [Alphaproteobacteria bacterium]